MIKRITTLLLCCSAIAAFSQTSTKTFIVTSDTNSPIAYNHIRSIDVNAGKSIADIFDISQPYVYRNHSLRSYEKKTGLRDGKTPMGGAVAGMAFDAKNNRLYYIPQHTSELRYLDLKQAEPSFTCFEGQSLNLLRSKDDVANQVSRMVIGADGFGYALTNDGEHFIRFSTDNTPIIQDMGVLVNNPTNPVMVGSSCTSLGGDMVAAADGSLYLITSRNHIFRITVSDKQAYYIGMIKNLPQEFTSNGASVDEDGNLLVSCGASLGKNFSPLYKVSINTLEAQPVGAAIGTGNIADMASSNLLFQQNEKQATSNTSFLHTQQANKLPQINIFPNPVTSGWFQIKTSNISEKAEYTIRVLDAANNIIMENRMSMGSKTATQSFNLPAHHAKGVYFVQMVDAYKRTVYSQLLIVE